MKFERPRFELARVYSDGTTEAPEIVPVMQMPWETQMNRRGFMGAGLTGTAVLMVLVGCKQRTVKEVDIRESPELERKGPDTLLQAHQGTVKQLLFSADSTTLVSSSSDNTVKQWSVPDGKLLATVKESSFVPLKSAITSDGKILIASSGSEIGFWSLPRGASLKKLSEAKSNFALSDDGKIVAFQFGKSVKLCSVPEGDLVATLSGYEREVVQLAFAPNGKMLLAGALMEEAKLWSVPEGSLLGTLTECRFSSKAPSFFNPESNTFGSMMDGQIKLWSLPDGRPVKTNRTDAFDVIEGLLITPDGKMLVTLSRYFSTSSSPSAFPGTNKGERLAIRLWSFPEMELLTLGKAEPSGPLLANTYVDVNRLKLAVTPDSRTLAVLFSGSTVELLSLPDLKLENVLKGTTNQIESVAISRDGKFLTSGDSAGTIMLWDLEKREFLTYLFDQTANKRSVKGVTYHVKDKVTGHTITYTLPCGSAIPAGAVCTCNCVPGTYVPYTPPVPRTRSGGGFGTVCTCNQVCTCIPVPSDREAKEAFEVIDPLLILQRLSELPIQKWNYKWDEATIHHIGPMAQDFAAAFAVGEDDKHIHPVDAQGVAFAAIQALYRIAKEKDAQIESAQAQLQTQQEESAKLKARVEALERSLSII